jgi:protein gp37
MNETPDIQYGRLLEAAEISGYAAHRAFEVTRGLLESGDWQRVGPGFNDVSLFVRSVPFGTLNPPEELRKSYERIAAEHGATQRAIADSAGVSQSTVHRDLAPDSSESGPGVAAATDLQEPEQASDVGDSFESQPLPDLPAGQDVADEILAGIDQQTAAPEPDHAPEIAPKRESVMLTLYDHTGKGHPYPKPQSKPTFNETTGEGISWAAWSWNPVTGCLHGCDYCYARAIIHRYPEPNPAGFTPLFHDERLSAPGNTTIPERHRDDPAYSRVFVCSMADLYGRWVPLKWIEDVHKAMTDNPQWEYLLLTKFPDRYVELELPATAWVGTSVDEQKRVRIAERAFRRIEGVKVKWLSLEPLREPLEFTDLSMFDWVVIGAQTATVQPTGPVPAFGPPSKWVDQIKRLADAAGIPVHEKPNLYNGNPGAQPRNEYPA